MLLPIGTFAETSGTYVNCEGQWQSQPGAAQPLGEARPGWKVLRVLGNLLNLERFDYQSSEEVLAEVRQACAGAAPAPYRGRHVVAAVMPGAGGIDGGACRRAHVPDRRGGAPRALAAAHARRPRAAH